MCLNQLKIIFVAFYDYGWNTDKLLSSGKPKSNQCSEDVMIDDLALKKVKILFLLVESMASVSLDLGLFYWFIPYTMLSNMHNKVKM